MSNFKLYGNLESFKSADDDWETDAGFEVLEDAYKKKPKPPVKPVSFRQPDPKQEPANPFDPKQEPANPFHASNIETTTETYYPTRENPFVQKLNIPILTPPSPPQNPFKPLQQQQTTLFVLQTPSFAVSNSDFAISPAAEFQRDPQQNNLAKKKSFIIQETLANQNQIIDMPNVNVHVLASKYAFFTPSEISAFHQQFSTFDKEGRDSVHQGDLQTVATKTGENYQAVVDKLQNLKLSNQQGYVSFESFLKAVSKVKEEKGGAGASKAGDKTKITLHGHSENTTHTINEDEKQSFVEHINSQLAGDKDIKHRLPIDSSTMAVFAECKDGLVLAKLINDSVPGTIDERVLNLGKKFNTFQMTENNNVVVNSAKAIGCSVVNIGSQDLIEGREHLILGLIWQIIKIGLSTKVDIKVHPELFRLLEPGETLEEFLKLPTDQILLRWFNYHLKKAGWPKTVKNFNSDVKDGESYTVLLNQLKPAICSRAPLQERDLMNRAEMVLCNADKLGCRKYLTPKTLTNGNAKLNFAFVANLFNNHPGLDPLSDAEMAGLDDWLFGSEAFALWMNSLGVDPFVNSLFEDLKDGLVLLQAIDKVQPNLVDWRKVNKAPVTSKFKKVENTNYVTVLGKSMKFSLVGIQGSDIVDGQKTLTLALVWQLMREHVIQTLKVLSKNGRDITDSDIVKWANDTVKRGGKSSVMSNFKDGGLRSGVFFLDLLNGMKKGIVDFSLVTNGVGDENAKMNAKYAISIARKIGATIFVLPEDIVEVKSKMILTFVGTLMALDQQTGSGL